MADAVCMMYAMAPEKLTTAISYFTIRWSLVEPEVFQYFEKNYWPILERWCFVFRRGFAFCSNTTSPTVSFHAVFKAFRVRNTIKALESIKQLVCESMQLVLHQQSLLKHALPFSLKV
mmetsp:Transcript_37559/g.60839  ORF Transcript_37559/g.60839 Transcript_37559/m.60839 type:complete len:118 (+) Transcript_37559:476-829(+)